MNKPAAPNSFTLEYGVSEQSLVLSWIGSTRLNDFVLANNQRRDGQRSFIHVLHSFYSWIPFKFSAGAFALVCGTWIVGIQNHRQQTYTSDRPTFGFIRTGYSSDKQYRRYREANKECEWPSGAHGDSGVISQSMNWLLTERWRELVSTVCVTYNARMRCRESGAAFGEAFR